MATTCKRTGLRRFFSPKEVGKALAMVGVLGLVASILLALSPGAEASGGDTPSPTQQCVEYKWEQKSKEFEYTWTEEFFVTVNEYTKWMIQKTPIGGSPTGPWTQPYWIDDDPSDGFVAADGATRHLNTPFIYPPGSGHYYQYLLTDTQTDTGSSPTKSGWATTGSSQVKTGETVHTDWFGSDPGSPWVATSDWRWGNVTDTRWSSEDLGEGWVKTEEERDCTPPPNQGTCPSGYDKIVDDYTGGLSWTADADYDSIILVGGPPGANNKDPDGRDKYFTDVKDGETISRVKHDISHICGILSDDPPPPVIEQCVTYDSVHTTDLTTWDLSQSRATGHNELIEDGLKIWTEGATSTDKAAGYYSTDFLLSGLGTETIAQMLDYTADFGIAPGLQLVVDFDNDGTPDGILVGEAVYGNNWWLTNSAAQFVKDGSPNTGGGYGSSWYGTPNEWLEAFPDARVKAIGYSLGSGVYASGVIAKITVGCVEYTFGIPEPLETTPERPTWVDPCGLDNGYWEYTDTDEYYYEVTVNPNGSQTIRAYAKDGYEFPEGTKTQWTKKDSGELCPPELITEFDVPTASDVCGIDDDVLTIPDDTDKVKFEITSDTRVSGVGSVTVGATAKAGFAFADDMVTTWTFEFTDKSCGEGNDLADPKNDYAPGSSNTWLLWLVGTLAFAMVGGALFATRHTSQK